MYDYSDYISTDKSIWSEIVSNDMYQILYHCLVLILLIAILVLAIMIFLRLNKVAKGRGAGRKMQQHSNTAVFCQKCGARCSTEDVVCPKCGENRR